MPENQNILDDVGFVKSLDLREPIWSGKIEYDFKSSFKKYGSLFLSLLIVILIFAAVGAIAFQIKETLNLALILFTLILLLVGVFLTYKWFIDFKNWQQSKNLQWILSTKELAAINEKGGLHNKFELLSIHQVGFNENTLSFSSKKKGVSKKKRISLTTNTWYKDVSIICLDKAPELAELLVQTRNQAMQEYLSTQYPPQT